FETGVLRTHPAAWLSREPTGSTRNRAEHATEGARRASSEVRPGTRCRGDHQRAAHADSGFESRAHLADRTSDGRRTRDGRARGGEGIDRRAATGPRLPA